MQRPFNSGSPLKLHPGVAHSRLQLWSNRPKLSSKAAGELEDPNIPKNKQKPISLMSSWYCDQLIPSKLKLN